MRSLLFFLLLLLFALCLPSLASAQQQLSLSSTPIELSGIESVTLQIPADLDTFQFTEITFFLQGGDGGKASRDARTGQGGHGAQTTVTFPFGKTPGALRPGGLLRFVVGDKGENTSGSGTVGGSGGGGGSAILYKDPGVTHTGGTVPELDLLNSINYGWTLLAVAGGGGGGYIEANTRTNGNPGENTTAGSNGRSTGGSFNAGGTNGAAGIDQTDGGGAGTGYLTTGGVGNNGYNGLAGGITGQQGDDFANRAGGYGYGPGGHGRRNAGGGGGGGFSGGGAGRNGGSAGGGGGSFASASSTTTSIIKRSDTNTPDPGLITYVSFEDLTPGPSPEAFCKESITVTINDGQPVFVNGLDIDDGSTNPLPGDLAYFVCVPASNGGFTCADERRYDCSDVGPGTRLLYLAVQNSSDITYCATRTVINVVAGTGVPPTCPINREVDLNSGCSGTLSSFQLRPRNEGDCTTPTVSLTLPNATTENDPPDFFNGNYVFVSGTTTVTYTNTVGSCSFEVTLNAGNIPDLQCPNNRVFTDARGDCTRNVNDVFTDLFSTDPGNITYRITDGTIDSNFVTGTGFIGDYDFLRGVNTVEYFQTDPGGCVSACDFTISVSGAFNNRPELSCEANLTVEFDPELTVQDLLELAVISVTDECGVLSLEFDRNDPDIRCQDIGDEQDLTIIASDGDREEDCDVTITLVETTPPVMACLPAITLPLNPSGIAGIGPDDVDAGTTADCDLTLRVNDRSGLDFRCRDLGENVVTLSASTEEGPTASCTTTVTVVDERMPTPVCRNLTLILGETGEAFLAAVNLDDGSTDNCSVTEWSADRTVFTCDDIGNNSVDLTVTDQSGNSASCTTTVTVEDSPAGYCATLLPVTLASFTGSAQNKFNALEWVAVSEEAFSHYEVQRSLGGGTAWQHLGAVAGARDGGGAGGVPVSYPNAGALSYEFIDRDPAFQAYYRLRMVDLDGTFSFSNLVFLEQAAVAELIVFPNPTNGRITIQLPTQEATTLQLFDLNRKLLSTATTNASAYELQLDQSAGVYLLVATSADGRWTRRVVVR